NDQKGRLAERPDTEDAPARGCRNLLGLELVVRALAVRLDEVGDAMRTLEAPRVDIDPKLRELVEVGLALGELFFECGHAIKRSTTEDTEDREDTEEILWKT